MLKLPPDSIIFLSLALVILGLPSAGQYLLDQQRYKPAIRAYKNGDCTTAIEQFGEIIDSYRLFDFGNFVLRSKNNKIVCEYLQTAVNNQKKGEFETALINYSKVVENDESYTFQKSIQKQIDELFQKNEIDSFATLSVCNKLNLLSQQGMLAKENAKVPKLYLACGKIYTENQKNDKARNAYERFLQQYPNHTLTKDVQLALAEIPQAVKSPSSSSPETSPPVQKLPSNGVVSKNWNSEPDDILAPLSIETRGNEHHFFKLVDIVSNQPTMTIFVQASTNVPVKVPLGIYKIKYASGTQWYGNELLFGSKTQYGKVEKLFEFTIEENQVLGHNIQFYPHATGNLKTRPIDPIEF